MAQHFEAQVESVLALQFRNSSLMVAAACKIWWISVTQTSAEES